MSPKTIVPMSTIFEAISLSRSIEPLTFSKSTSSSISLNAFRLEPRANSISPIIWIELPRTAAITPKPTERRIDAAAKAAAPAIIPPGFAAERIAKAAAITATTTANITANPAICSQLISPRFFTTSIRTIDTAYIAATTTTSPTMAVRAFPEFIELNFVMAISMAPMAAIRIPTATTPLASVSGLSIPSRITGTASKRTDKATAIRPLIFGMVPTL